MERGEQAIRRSRTINADIPEIFHFLEADTPEIFHFLGSVFLPGVLKPEGEGMFWGGLPASEVPGGLFGGIPPGTVRGCGR